MRYDIMRKNLFTRVLFYMCLLCDGKNDNHIKQENIKEIETFFDFHGKIVSHKDEIDTDNKF